MLPRLPVPRRRAYKQHLVPFRQHLTRICKRPLEPPNTLHVERDPATAAPSPPAQVTQLLRFSTERLILDRVVFEQVVGQVIDWIFRL